MTNDITKLTSLKISAFENEQIQTSYMEGYGGFYVASLTTAQQEKLPLEDGLIIYNTSDKEFQFYEDGNWKTLGKK